MKLKRVISQLFELSEELGAIRNSLQEASRVVTDHDELLNIYLSIKEIDIIRITLLYEYELLNTSAVVQTEHLSLYYDRRLEILLMTKEQILGHYEELQGCSKHITYKEALQGIYRAAEVIDSASRLLDDITEMLDQHIMKQRSDKTMH
ncbi:MAG: hypothetical protein JRF28_10705 [Deltaproteobacteria bacterium]|nr:hypothetical protein [Deltaproteobacteria bacterium]MBW2266608.1 hypothetical protein [Deltaproteobacteria bacterium]OEU45514.1 MAG: hypothetical protein BBJ60_07400 [Desulfobacterales bacterium S7086C20]